MCNEKINRFALFNPTCGTLLSILLFTFFVMMIAVSHFQMWIQESVSDVRSAFLFNSTVQCIFLFILPSLSAAFLCSRKPLEYLGLERPTAPRQYFSVLLLFVLAIPIENFIIDWNAGLRLPDGMKDMEALLRQWEENAAGVTDYILSDASWWGLISGVLIVGVLTGFAEELFFRAGFLRALVSSKMNRHLAVWLTAFIFSFLHFQFFGFVPRLLIGAGFGYLFVYTGSLWLAAFAHILNNSLVVIVSWLEARGYIPENIERIGDAIAGNWIAATACALLFALYLLLYRPALKN